MYTSDSFERSCDYEISHLNWNLFNHSKQHICILNSKIILICHSQRNMLVQTENISNNKLQHYSKWAILSWVYKDMFCHIFKIFQVTATHFPRVPLPLGWAFIHFHRGWALSPFTSILLNRSNWTLKPPANSLISAFVPGSCVKRRNTV